MLENKLDNDFKKNGFKVPQNYFEQLDNNIISALYSKDTVVKLTFWHKNKRWLVAASITTIAIVGAWYNNVIKIQNTNTFASITAQEYTEFENETDITDEDINDLLSTEAIDSIYKLEIVPVNNYEELEIAAPDTLTEYNLFEEEIEI